MIRRDSPGDYCVEKESAMTKRVSVHLVSRVALAVVMANALLGAVGPVAGASAGDDEKAKVDDGKKDDGKKDGAKKGDAGKGPGKKGPSKEEEQRLEREAAVELPYTLDDLKKLRTPGLVIEYRITMTKKDGTQRIVIERHEVVAADDEGFTRRLSRKDADGNPKGEPRENRQTWHSDWIKRPLFQKDATVVTEERVTVEAGELACKVYTETKPGRDGAEQKKTSWFSTEHPGLEVLQVDEGGRMTFRMELIELVRP